MYFAMRCKDAVRSYRKPGSYQQMDFAVYCRKAKPCNVCKKAIARIVKSGLRITVQAGNVELAEPLWKYVRIPALFKHRCAQPGPGAEAASTVADRHDASPPLTNDSQKHLYAEVFHGNCGVE